MSRTRQPTELHVVKGTYRKNPQRKPKDEPQPAGPIGEPDADPSTDWRECWHEITNNACASVLGSSDRIAVEIAARLLAEMREDMSSMPAARLRLLDSLLAKFGMTPADRSKVTAWPNDDTGPGAKYLK